MFTKISIATIILPFFQSVMVEAAPKPLFLRDGIAKRAGFNSAITENFPDPCIIKSVDTYYAFATNDHGHNVQIATSNDFSSWTVLDQDAFPNEGFPFWVDASAPNIWAPDVYQRNDGKYVLTYSAQVSGGDSPKHCVGVAVSDQVTGPYSKTSDSPLACPDPKNLGGAIDSSYFHDPDSDNLYIVYKVDGNSVGKETPILLQQVSDDGFTLIGGTVQILVNGQYDGPVVEAPSLVKKNGLYVLFFSSNMYNTPLYDISYATATAVDGPYTKSDQPLLVTGTGGLAAPGGADAMTDGTKIVFHANVGEVPDSPRGMWVGEIEIDSGARKVYI